ncbi:MAG: helix-turn-helix domain-containing protein [Bacteroidota bacterium]
MLLVAPIRALRLGLRALLADSGIEIAGEADRLHTPDLMDLEADVIIYAPASGSFPELKQNAVAPAGTTPVLFLSDDPPGLQSLALSPSAWGALPLECTREELIAAVQALSQGLIAGAPRFFQPRPLAHADGEAAPLSEREMEVLGLLARGLANKQIGARLGISEHTVKFHVSSIYTKLNVTNRAEAVHQGVRQGLIAL